MMYVLFIQDFLSSPHRLHLCQWTLDICVFGVVNQGSPKSKRPSSRPCPGVLKCGCQLTLKGLTNNSIVGPTFLRIVVIRLIKRVWYYSMSNIYIYVPTTTIWGLSLITSHFLLMHVIPTLVFGYSFPRGSSVFFWPLCGWAPRWAVCCCFVGFLGYCRKDVR
jgi:hypothetical protein